MMRPVAIDDLVRYQYLSDPQISPDGRRVAFVVRMVTEDRQGYSTGIRIVPVDASAEPREFTAGAKTENSPRWSPDGHWMAFLSDRGGSKPQLWVMSSHGGEARQLTELDDAVSDPAWSPDSRIICCAVKQWSDQTERPPDGQQPMVRVIDRLRHKYNGEGFLVTRKRLFVVPLEGTPRQLTDGDWDDVQATWSPDGRTIAFVSNREPDRDTSFNADIWLVTSAGGEPRRLTGADGAFGSPAWSPDGRLIAYVGNRKPPETGPTTNPTVWVIAAEGGEPRNLSAAQDRDVGSSIGTDMRASPPADTVVWRADGQAIRYLANDHGTVPLFEVDLEGRVRELIGGRRQIVSFSTARDCALAFDALDAARPAEVFVAASDGTGERRLTHLNDALIEELDVRLPERFTVTGDDGTPIESWLLTPPGFDPTRKYPLLLEIHGGPHAAYGWAYFHAMQVLAAAGYLVLFANPRYSVGYGQAHVTGRRGDWGGQDYDDLMRAVDAACERPYVDNERLGVLGGSYGGFMVNWIVSQTDRFKAAISDRSVANRSSSFGTGDIHYHTNVWEWLGCPWEQREHYARRSPINYVERIRTPMLLIHGEQDLRCPIEQSEQLFVSLKVLGREVVMVRYPDESHELSRSGRPDRRLDRLERMVAWFERYL